MKNSIANSIATALVLLTEIGIAAFGVLIILNWWL
jgi:hypothetical protein